MNTLNRERGFSLIEILIAAVVVGIMLAMVVPKLLPAKEEAYISEMKNSINNMVDAQESYMNANDQYASTITALGTATGFSKDEEVNLVLTISHTQYGYTVTATHNKSQAGCGMFVGASGPSGTQYNGRLRCSLTGIPSGATAQGF